MKLPHFTFCGGREYKTSTFFFPELQYKLLEFNSRKICQHLTNWTRWNKRDKFCLSSLVINIQRTLFLWKPLYNWRLVKFKRCQPSYNSFFCIEDTGSVTLVSRAFVTVFRVFFAKPSKCEWSHPSQVFLCLGLTFSWTVTRLKPSGVRCWRTLELWGPFCGLVFSLGITKVLFLQSPILNIDIAPTIVELAGGKAPESMDGRSILPLLVCSFEPLFTFFFSSFCCCCYLPLFKGASQNSELASQSGHFENEILVFSRNLC